MLMKASSPKLQYRLLVKTAQIGVYIHVKKILNQNYIKQTLGTHSQLNIQRELRI
jgi:hypothetical protein